MNKKDKKLLVFAGLGIGLAAAFGIGAVYYFSEKNSQKM